MLLTVLLVITSDGDKLTPMVIFKAKEYKTVYKKLLSVYNVIKGLLHVECNNNTWITETIIKNWFDIKYEYPI